MHTNLTTLALAVVSIVVTAACSHAGAQNFNIDFDNTIQGSPDGGPSDNYGAALGQLGHWHGVLPPVGGPVGLVDILGNRTAATVTVQSGSLSYGAGVALSPDGNHLWRDGFSRTSLLTLTFSGLENGTYYAATIVDASPRTLRISVSPSSDGVQLASGSHSDTFMVGSTHTLHHSHVVDGNMTVTILDAASVSPRASVAGIQLRRCASDVNGDGVSDFFDYLDFVDAYSSQASSADFNHDGVIDFFDYLDFVDALSAGC